MSWWSRPRAAVAGERPLTEKRLLRLWLPLLLPCLLLGAAWFGPALLAWDQYRGRIAEVAGERLGRSVSIEGPISLSLLPKPRLEANAVAIGPAADGLTVKAKALRLQLALLPLLAGRLEPRALTLVGGEIVLPWPPLAVPTFRPPSWLSALDARVEDSRMSLGGLVFEGLNAKLIAPGPNEPITAEGTAQVRHLPVRFSAQLGRAGDDGIAPLDLGLVIAGASLNATGLLIPSDGFEGRLEAAGPELSTLLPAPPIAFRAQGKLTATASLFAADALALDLAGEPARGALSFRIAPQPQLDLALNAGRINLDPWLVALRSARLSERGLPFGLDLAAERATLAGVPLRKLRGTLQLRDERLWLSDVAAALPGDTNISMNGSATGEQLDAAIAMDIRALRDGLAALGWQGKGLAAHRWQGADARFQLRLRDGEAVISDLSGTLDGAAISGGGTWRSGARPFYGVELNAAQLDLGALYDLLPNPQELSTLGAATDFNLRFAAARASLLGETITRAGLDLSVENGRLSMRRLAFRHDDVDWSAVGAAQLGAKLRLHDAVLEAQGPKWGALAPLLPAALRPFTEQRLALKLAGHGPTDAMTWSGDAELGDLRLEGSGHIDLDARRGKALLTARHPGALRLLAPWLGDTGDWLGPGSFALVANLSGNSTAVTAEHMDLVLGTLRGRGQLTWAQDGARPRLRGRFQADTLPLPQLSATDITTIPFGALDALDADLALEAGTVDLHGTETAREMKSQVRLEAGSLRLDKLEARVLGGGLRGTLELEGTASPPQLGADLTLTDLGLAGPLFDHAFDLGAGRISGEAQLKARGHSQAALLATLSGKAQLAIRDGVLVGFNLGRIAATGNQPSLAASEAGLREALAGGATAFESLNAAFLLRAGEGQLVNAEIALAGGGTATAEGTIDFARKRLDLRLQTRPIPDAPPIALRLNGAAIAPQRQPEIADFLRWRADQ